MPWRLCAHAGQAPAVLADRQWFCLQFIDRVLGIPVVPQRQVRTVQQTGDSTVQFLVWLLTRPFLRNGRCRGVVAVFVVECGSSEFMTGLLVWILFALCSLLPSTGLRCLASWSVWTRRAVMVAGFCWLRFYSRCVLFVCRLAPGVRHWYAVQRFVLQFWWFASLAVPSWTS